MTTSEAHTTTPTDIHHDEIPPILGANPFVGLTGQQVAAALGRLAQRVVVEPGVIGAQVLETSRQLLEVGIGRSDISPEHGDKRFIDGPWTNNPLYHRLMQTYLVQRTSVLRLVDANNPSIALAKARVEEAYQRWQQAQVLWLPTINVGSSYLRHDGQIQNARGLVFTTSRSSLFGGGGAFMRFDAADALFLPRVSRHLTDAEASRSQAVTQNEFKPTKPASGK